MIKILDLFSGTQSVRKALDDMNVEYEYYGIDIYSPEEENIILDLSQDDIVTKVIAALPQDWKPDFIWASPTCSRFSVATSTKGGNLYFEKTSTGIKPREDISVLDWRHKKYTLEYIQSEAKLHLKLVINMQKVIDYYNVSFAIENPRSSFIKKIMSPLYVMNKVDYCMYGLKYVKPTTIYSNYVLDLKTCNHKTHEQSFQNNTRDYAQRSKVPPTLIQHIFRLMGVKIEQY